MRLPRKRKKIVSAYICGPPLHGVATCRHPKAWWATGWRLFLREIYGGSL